MCISLDTASRVLLLLWSIGILSLRAEIQVPDEVLYTSSDPCAGLSLYPSVVSLNTLSPKMKQKERSFMFSFLPVGSVVASVVFSFFFVYESQYPVAHEGDRAVVNTPLDQIPVDKRTEFNS